MKCLSSVSSAFQVSVSAFLKGRCVSFNGMSTERGESPYPCDMCNSTAHDELIQCESCPKTKFELRRLPRIKTKYSKHKLGIKYGKL